MKESYKIIFWHTVIWYCIAVFYFVTVVQVPNELINILGLFVTGLIIGVYLSLSRTK